jgi:predicted Zn-dependent protease with MMP-like domain
MLSIDEFGKMLNEIADEMPEEMFKELNGGVVLVEHSKIHPESNISRKLYIMGEYHHQSMGLGRYIIIYYGSFVNVHSYKSDEQLKEEIRRVVHHEFLHHLESLAGERGLEIEDAHDIARYKARFSNVQEHKK